MTVTLSPDGLKRARAIFGACDAALVRLNHASLGVGAPVFGPLGESLTWLCALDQLLKDADPTYAARRDGHPEGCVIPGLRWARNQAVHGVTVVEMIGVIPGAQPGLMRLGLLSQLGSVQTCYWCGRLALPPPGQPPGHGTEQSYDQYVGGKPLKTPLVAAHAFVKAEADI